MVPPLSETGPGDTPVSRIRISRRDLDSIAFLGWTGAKATTATRTKAGVLAFAVDLALISTCMILSVSAGLVQTDTHLPTALFGMQATGILAFLMLNDGYRDPAKIDVARNFVLTTIAVVVATLIAVSPALIAGAGQEQQLLVSLGLSAGVQWSTLFTGRGLFAEVIRRHRDSLARHSTVLMIRSAAEPSALELLPHIQEGARNCLSPTEVFDIVGAGQEGLRTALVRGRKPHVRDVVFALPWESEEKLWEAVGIAAEYAVSVHIFPDQSKLYLNHPVQIVGGIPVITVVVSPLTPLQIMVKRLFDLAGSSLILLATLPLLGFIALAIKLDSRGPVLFRQTRHGYNNQPFQILKFRSMHVASDDGYVVQATRDDRRVTRVGKILRRTSLDELPQVFNVIKGDMSLIGPRPHAKAHHDHYRDPIEGYRFRHRVKPGITGLAQVQGYRGETDTPEKMAGRVRKDLEYIENWSLSLDIRIFLMTLILGFYHRNAY